jgi:Ni/Co efflux regulator RcnB
MVRVIVAALKHKEYRNMKRLLTAISAIALMASAAGAASADPYHNGHGGPPGAWQSRHPDWRTGRRMGMNDWRGGQRVDYRRYHLRAPPRGYEWREVDGNYVLAADATGLIASIIAASH